MEDKTSMFDEFGTWYLVRTNELHLPQLRASWYDGGIYMTGNTAQLPGETPTQAALRAFGQCIATKWLDTLTVYELTLTRECPSDNQICQARARQQRRQLKGL